MFTRQIFIIALYVRYKILLIFNINYLRNVHFFVILKE
jgi:hypothetical protein